MLCSDSKQINFADKKEKYMALRLYNYGKFLCKRDKMNSRKDCWYALLKAANHFEGFESPEKHVPCLVLRQYEHAFMKHYLYCQVEEDVEELKKKEEVKKEEKETAAVEED